MKKIASIILLVGLFALSVVGVSQAQISNLNAITLTAIPPRLGDNGEIKVKPGEKFQTSVRITNNSDQEVSVESLVQDFVIGDDGKTPVIVKEEVSNRWSLASWITLTPSNQVIAAKKTAVVTVLIEVPADALPGGHFAIIAHRPSAGQVGATGSSNTGVTQQVGSILYVTVAGDIQESAFIHGFTFKPTMAEFGPMHFYYTVENQSDIHIKPQAAVEIFNIFRHKVATIPVETSNVFPGSRRAFDGVWPINWGFGPYHAVLTLTYGTGGQVATAATTVWLLPLSIIIAILIVLLALITGGIVIKRHLDYRKDMAKKEALLRNATDATAQTNPKETP